MEVAAAAPERGRGAPAEVAAAAPAEVAAAAQATAPDTLA